MTITDNRTSRVLATRDDGRSDLSVAAQQLDAIEVFNRALRTVEQAAAVIGCARETRMDAVRRLDVFRREHRALVSRAHEQLCATGDLLTTQADRRVVVAHSSPWFLQRVAEELDGRGMRVVAQVDNGADAVGIAVAEQPDLVLVAETLTMVPGEQVLRDVRRFCPTTLVAVQVANGSRVGPFLDAGAAAVFTQQVAAPEVAEEMDALLQR